MTPLLLSLESLEPRRLLAATFDLVDLGVTNAPAGEGMFDVNTFILGPSGLSQYKNRKLYTSALVPSGAVGNRLNPSPRYGAIVLGSMPFAGLRHAAMFYEHNGTGIHAKDVGTLSPTGSSDANAMGARSSIVGHSEIPGGNTHAFYATYRNNRYYMFDLNDLRPSGINWTFTEGIDINQSGQILVSGIDGDGAVRNAVIKPKSNDTDALELADATGQTSGLSASDLNDLGQVVGAGDDHALLWTLTSRGARVTDLGGLGGQDAAATRINNQGYIVGDATTPADHTHAFLYDPSVGHIADLNALTNTGGLTIRHAAGISDGTTIVGEATDSAGNRHVVLLIPTDPIPALPTGATQNQSAITVNGTTGDDHIVVRLNARRTGALDVSINGRLSQFDASTVSRMTINGGPGNDLIEISGSSRQMDAVVNAHSGNDRIIGGTGLGELFASGGDGDDQIQGLPDALNSMDGGAGNDTLVGGNRPDSVYGGLGDDSLDGAGAGPHESDHLRGESGNDTIRAGAGADIIDGGAGNDSILSGAGSDDIRPGVGDDTVDAGDDNDTVFAGPGNDDILGGAGDDFLYGEAGDDTLLGQGGDDTLGGDAGFTGALVSRPTPQPGDDWLDGGRGNDDLVGSRASLTFADDNGTDTMTGGPGGDVIDARGDDVATDAGPDDISPAAQTYGTGALAVQQTATLQISMPAAAGDPSILTSLPDGMGKFDRSTFYADADGTLHMQDTVARSFHLGEFFRNWGVPVEAGQKHNNHFGGFPVVGITVNGQQPPLALDRWTVHAGDAISVIILA
ncbi:MAG TPA: hypothetical protein VH475_09580 [Tepidisphaeraceae bacterium]|jgi:probable HAF family extracellular repeat protein